MNEKSIKKNFIYNLIYQILNIIIPLITVPYVSRILRADGIGTVSYAESIVSYFVLFARLGIYDFGQREISYVQNDRRRRSQAFWEVQFLSTIVSGIICVLYLLFAIHQNNRNLYLILSFHILAVTFDITWFFKGTEDFGRIVRRNIFFRIVILIYIFLFVRTKEDIVPYACALSVSSFLINISMWWDVRRFIDKPIVSELRPMKNIKPVISLFLPSIAIQLYTVLDKTMLGIITQDPAQNGYYEMAMRMTKMVLAVVTAMSAVMVSRIGFYFENKRTDLIQEMMYKSFRLLWFMGMPLCFGLFGVASNFVPWFFGEGYLPVIDLLRILAILILVVGVTNTIGWQYLIPTKRQNWFTMSAMIGASTNVILNIILIPLYGAFGAAVASVIAEMIIAAVQLYLIRKEIDIKQILKSCQRYLLASIGMLAIVYTEAVFFAPSIVNTGLIIISGGVLYIAFLLLEKEEFILEGRQVLKNKLKQRG